MEELATEICDTALPVGTAPDWVHLLPAGETIARDGRRFVLANPQAVIDNFEAAKVDLPVDFEHQAEKPESRLKGPVPAAGWIKGLEMRADGLWGRVEWTATAARMIGAKEYRYISPAMTYNVETCEILSLKGAGLVHHPALHLTALAAEQEPGDGKVMFLERVAQMLGLDGNASPEAVLAGLDKILAAFKKVIADVTGQPKPETTALMELGSLVPNPARYMPTEAVATLAREHQEAVETLRVQRVQLKVDKALKEHFITNGMRQWATALCHSDEAAFDAYCSGVPRFEFLFKPSGLDNRSHPGLAVHDPVEALICSQLGLQPGALSK